MQKDSLFAEELLNRFFNKNSYFFQCINTEFDLLLRDPNVITNEKHLLYGNLIDRLIYSNNVSNDFKELSCIDEINQFYVKLKESIQYFRDEELDSGKIRTEIEKVAKLMVRSVMHALDKEESRNKLAGIINNSQGMSPEELPINDEEKLEPLSEEPGLAESAFLLEDVDFPKQESEEMDFLPRIDEGKEARSTTEAGNSTEESGSNFSSDGNGMQPWQLSPEPTSMVEVFYQAIKQNLETLYDVLRLLKEDTKNQSAWEECHKIFDQIAARAMVYGFEAFEEIAHKSNRMIEQLKSTPNLDRDSVLLKLNAATLALSSFLETPDAIDAQEVESVSQKLVITKQTSSRNQPSETDVDEKKPPRFKLPGEDDEEILNLVKELTSERKKNNNEEENSRNPNEADSENPKQNDNGESLNLNLVKNVCDDEVFIYKRKADLYFCVIEETLEKLEQSPKDESALEDLKLAGDSLYELTSVMNLDQLDQFPILMIDIARNIVSNEYILSPNEAKLLRSAIQHYRGVVKVDDNQLERDLGKIENLNNKILKETEEEFKFILS